jgi:hypothetical protein
MKKADVDQDTDDEEMEESSTNRKSNKK